jgi:hypothetical protein
VDPWIWIAAGIVLFLGPSLALTAAILRHELLERTSARSKR